MCPLFSSSTVHSSLFFHRYSELLAAFSCGHQLSRPPRGEAADQATPGLHDRPETEGSPAEGPQSGLLTTETLLPGQLCRLLRESRVLPRMDGVVAK